MTDKLESIKAAREKANSWTMRQGDAEWVYDQAMILVDGDMTSLISEVLHKRLLLRLTTLAYAGPSYWPSAVEVGRIVEAAVKDYVGDSPVTPSGG